MFYTIKLMFAFCYHAYYRQFCYERDNLHRWAYHHSLVEIIEPKLDKQLEIYRWTILWALVMLIIAYIQVFRLTMLETWRYMRMIWKEQMV